MNLDGGNPEYYKKLGGVWDWVDDIYVPEAGILTHICEYYQMG